MPRASTNDTIEYRSGEVGRKSEPSSRRTRAIGMRDSGRPARSAVLTIRSRLGKSGAWAAGISSGAPPSHQPTESIHCDVRRVWNGTTVR